MGFFSNISQFLHTYRMHILVFLAAGLIAMTFAHPSIFINDEWVTVNQLSQLHEGHQILYNEGKYGTYENGTLFTYFRVKENYLAYPLFLPVISLPAYWILDLFGSNTVFVILYLWTFLLIALALVLSTLFPEYTYIGKWRWTNGLIVVIFGIFFLNLFFYRSFPVIGKGTYPEIFAIVFTHVVLFAFLALLIYEICRTIFEEQGYALFGTMTCISCSSYFFWTTFCKDHLLVAFLVTAIILLLVKLVCTENPVFLPAAFCTSGLLAWARPELALAVAVILCIFVLYLWFYRKIFFSNTRDRLLILLSPLFTFIGAIPFFINNYIFTRNIFVPASILWTNQTSSPVTALTSSTIIQQNVSDTTGSLLFLFKWVTNFNPSTFLTDLFGILFSPQSGSMGIVPIIPIFLVAILLLPVLIARRTFQFTKKDHQIFGILVLLSLGIFLVYLGQAAVMNNDMGIAPDMRYLSPIYLPLTLIGLLVFAKIPEISDRPVNLIKGILASWVVLIPISISLLGYLWQNKTWMNIYSSVNVFISIGIYLIAVLFLIAMIHSMIFFNKFRSFAKSLFIILCAIPLIWQINLSFIAIRIMARMVGFEGYSFWIPIVLRWFLFIQ